MHGSIPTRLPQCPYCKEPVRSWRRGSWIDPCTNCRRPIVLIRSPFDWNGPLRLRGLLDVAHTVYGIATVILVVSFALMQFSALHFVKMFTLLLFIQGSILITDGVLGALSRIDRTMGKLRSGRAAFTYAIGKIACGLCALALTAIGAVL